MRHKKTSSIIFAGALAATLGLSACSSDTATDTVAETPAAEVATPEATPTDPMAPDMGTDTTPTDPMAPDMGANTGEEMVGQDPGTWSPIVVTEELNGQTVQMVPGQAGIIPIDNPESNIVVETSDPEVVEVIQAEVSGEMTTQPGIVAKKVGTATVTVVDGFPADGEATVLFEFTVDIVQ